MAITSFPWYHLLIRIQQRGVQTFGCRKVEAWGSRWKCWHSIPFGTLKKVSVALKYKYTKAKAVKVLTTFSNVCCAYLNFNLKIKAMHDKYWSEIIFIWLRTVPSVSRVGVSMYQLIHSDALMTNEKNLREVWGVGAPSTSSLWDHILFSLLYNIIYNPPKWLYGAQRSKDPNLFLSRSAGSSDWCQSKSCNCTRGEQLAYSHQELVAQLSVGKILPLKI